MSAMVWANKSNCLKSTTMMDMKYMSDTDTTDMVDNNRAEEGMDM